jgi:ABC-type Fe3+-citrate transport system substrate-binding protein
MKGLEKENHLGHVTAKSTFTRVVVMPHCYADALAQSIGIEPQNRTRNTIS